MSSVCCNLVAKHASSMFVFESPEFIKENILVEENVSLVGAHVAV